MGGGAWTAAAHHVSRRSSGGASSVGAGPVSLRPARNADLAAVSAIECEAFSDPWPLSAFQEALQSPHLYFSVATTVHGDVVGYVIGWFVGGDGEIANIAVAPAYRGRGIGGQLLDDALAAARAAGSTMVHLEVRESNAPAQALYGSREFRAVGRRRGYYREPPEDAIVLRRAFPQVMREP